MKKLLPLLLVLSFSIESVRSQFVTISDSVFRSKLIAKYPSCFDANGKMDTACSSVLNEPILDVSGLFAITNLNGVQYFKSLKYLYCSNNFINNIPILPSSLKYFDCSNNMLVNLPSLPKGLKYINCSGNQLNSLPSLGDSLARLECYRNNIYCFPVLPKSLELIFFDSSKIRCIPNPVYAVFYDQEYQYIPKDMPVCNSANNPHSCPLTTLSVTGRVFYDVNYDGEYEIAIDSLKKDLKITLSGNSITYSDMPYNDKAFNSLYGGVYQFFPSSQGNYTLTTDPVSVAYKVVPSAISINLNDSVRSVVQDFALQATSNDQDSLFIYGGGFFSVDPNYNNITPPMYEAHCFGFLNIRYRNDRTYRVSPDITLNYDSSLVRFDHSSDNSVIDNGKKLMLHVSDLAPGEERTLAINFRDSSFGFLRIATVGGPLYLLSSILDSAGRGSYFTIRADVGILLPVKLTTWNVMKQNDNHAVLTWMTADETDTRSFTVEQSADGKNFVSIGTVDAKKQTVNNYTFQTNMLTSSVTYFRLKMVDKAGRYTYSDVKTVHKSSNESTSIDVFPNPARNIINIHTDNLSLINTNIKIVNSQGATVKNILLQNELQTVDLNNLPVGFYYLQTQLGVKKIMIVK